MIRLITRLIAKTSERQRGPTDGCSVYNIDTVVDSFYHWHLWAPPPQCSRYLLPNGHWTAMGLDYILLLHIYKSKSTANYI